METDQSPGTGPPSTMAELVRGYFRSDRRLRSLTLGFAFAAALGRGFVCEAAQKPAPQLHQTAASVLALSYEQAARGDPVLIRGVVTKATDYGLIVQDRTAGVWIHWAHPGDFAAGDEVEVKGAANLGPFSPVVMAQSVRKLGRSELPQPKTVTYRELSSGEMDCQYVTVTGIVRSVGIRPQVSQSQRVWLKLAMGDDAIDVTLPAQDAAAAMKLTDALVRIDAAVGSIKNQNRQITAPDLAAPGIHNITVLRPPPADLFATPLIPIGRLMQYRSGTDYYHRVRVAGWITYYKPGYDLILEDSGRALLVMTSQIGDFKLGDYVEAVGFLTPKDSGPILQDAVIRFIGSGQPIQPKPVRVADLRSGALNYNLVSIQGRLLRRVREPYREVLLLQDETNQLLAELPGPQDSDVLRGVQEGSSVRITGINILEVEGSWNVGGPGASAIRYEILLRSPADVRVIQPPSWWTKLHIIYLAAVLSVLMLACLVLVVYSRVERWRLEAVLDERERLAHEVHDTLAQSFAGIGFQLQAIQKAIPNNLPGLRQQVDLAQALVRHSHKEAQCSVEPLGPNTLGEVELLTSLEASARKMVEGGSVIVTTSTAGIPRPIPPQTGDALLRIGQESVANAVRHADPSHLDISLTYEKNAVRLAVKDDGIGFIKSGALLGFGLQGMRKRSAAISARLEIASQPGKGTMVEVTAPLPPNSTLVFWFRQKWKHSLEQIFHAEVQ